MIELTLYTRRGCHLCDVMKETVGRVLPRFGGVLREIDIDADPELQRRYGEEVPVLTIAGRKVAKYRIDEGSLIRLLEGRSP